MKLLEKFFSKYYESNHIVISILGIKLKLKKELYNKAYSEDGEDMVLNAFYEDKNNYKGFYIDIGAHHPKHISNTQFFYERGWHGINIDATPNSMKIFNKIRKNDINLEIAISDKAEELTYYIFECSGVNGFDLDTINLNMSKGHKIKQKIKIQAYTINEILDKYLPENQHIDFIDIDIEGAEEKILGTFNFEKYAPDYFLIEELKYKYIDFHEHLNSPIYKLLKEKGYIVVAKTYRTVIYKKV